MARVFGTAFDGCALTVPAARDQASVAATVAQLAGSPGVLRAEEDGRVHASAQDFAPYAWGLDRVDQCDLPLGGPREPVDAAGVRVYVVDTGIYGEHDEFDGAIDADDACHRSEVGGSALDDGHGHG